MGRLSPLGHEFELKKAANIVRRIFSFILIICISLVILSCANLKIDYYLARGDAYYEQGQLAQAIAAYTKAIQLAPDNADAYNNRGIAYGKKGEYPKQSFSQMSHNFSQ